MFEKLYELSYVENIDSFKISLSFSHSINKLEQSVPSQAWIVFSSPTHDNNKVRESTLQSNLEYPKYLIHEVNFII